jgi:hypothetical protein
MSHFSGHAAAPGWKITRAANRPRPAIQSEIFAKSGRIHTNTHPDPENTCPFVCFCGYLVEMHLFEAGFA